MPRSEIVGPLIGMVIGLFVGATAQAQSETPPIGTLTPDAVENLVTSFAAVQAKAEALRAQYDVPEDGTVAAQWWAWARVGEAKSELDASVSVHGFTDFETWLRTLSIVAQAYAFAREGAALDAKMAEALQRIESDPDISASQKEMMIQQLQHSVEAIAGIRPPRENVEAVSPYIDQLGVIFDDEG